MKLPKADRAVVDVAKLRDYSLNPTHPEGKHKARVLAAMLGFAADDAEKLRQMILAAVLRHEAAERGTDAHGTRYTVDFEARGLRDVATIRTAWIIDTGETIPRLVSCYVKRK
ncbi:MAG TPA: hypothetical protein VGX24_00155 [Pyrinomonadaceae bacterium]|nr:hypothetical protein [Pyrinomonadaceae bacterium]